MKKNRISNFKFPLLFCLFLPSLLPAMNHLMGTITTNNGKEKIPGAIIFWEGTATGTSTDSLGEFMLAWPDSFPSTLIVRAIGYKTKGLKFTGKNPSVINVDLAVN